MTAAFEPTAFENTAFEVLSSAPPPTVAPSSIVNPATGSLDWVIDPITRDFIDASDGGFVAGTDSRTAVLFQLECIYRAWWGDAFSGSRVRAIIAGDEPATPNDLRDEALRALQPLVNDGIISDLVVALDVDENGRVVVLLNYRDRSSGNPVDLAYVPFGG